MQSIYNFTDATEHTFDNTKIQITGGKASLKLQTVNQDFTEDFADDTDHTYDSDKSEFTIGKIQQKDQVNNAVSGANYNSSINLESWSGGVVTGTANGGATISGGKLDLAHNDVRYVEYSGTNNVSIVQTGTVKLKYTPNYNGSPSSDMDIILFRKADGDNTNLFLLRHATDGGIKLFIYGSDGAAIISNASFGAWSPTLGTEYEIALCPNITAGATRLFIDGIQLGSVMTQTGIRSSDIGQLITGTNANYTDVSNFKVDDLCFFDTVLYTENYTPGYSLPAYRYAETSDVLPEMEHSGDGTIKTFNTFSTTETGSPRYTLQIGRSGNYLYWDGSAWSVSDGTYAQASSSTIFNANAESLPVDGENYGQFKIIFPDSNTQSSVSELTANMGIELYLTTNPNGETVDTFYTDSISTITASETKSGNDEIKYILSKNGVDYYWNGSAWSVSDGTYSQANTMSDLNTNISSFTSSGIRTGIKWFLHSDTGGTTPEITSITITHSFFAPSPDTISMCTVWGYQYDLEGNASQETFTIILSDDEVQYKTQTMIRRETITITPDSNGYWEIDLVENENMENIGGASVQYIFNFGNDNILRRTIPNETSKNFYELET